MGRFLLVSATVLVLAGCEAVNGTGRALTPITPPLTSFVLLDGISVINTQKTLDDHVVSLITGKDCSTVRASEGERYCEDEPEVRPTLVRTTYCYKSLAQVSCYDHPFDRDATRLTGTRVDDIPLNPP